MSIALGVDGGGTKTHVVVADSIGRLLSIATTGPSNWEDVGLDSASSAVSASIAEALRAAGVEPSGVDAAVLGLAGMDWESDRDRLRVIPESVGLPRYEIVNDAFVALRAGANHPWGIVVVAGSGSVVAGRNPDGEEFRTLGLGAEFGDFGSALDMANEAIRAVAEAFVGFGPATTLTELLRERLDETSVESMLERLSRDPEEHVELAPVVTDAAEGGDARAKAIVERCGTSLAAAATVVARRLRMDDQPVEVVESGGIFRANGRLLLSTFERELRRGIPGAVPVRLEVPPVVGAALRALELAGEDPAGPVHLRLSLEVMKSLHYGFA